MHLVTLGHEDGSKMGGDDQVSLCSYCLEYLERHGCLPNDPFHWSIRKVESAEPCEDEICDGCAEVLT